jgi:hypothetical protein
MFSKWHNIDIVYQKHLDENNVADINLTAIDTKGICVSNGDVFTSEIEFSFWDKLFAHLNGDPDCNYYAKPKRISIYRNGIYDHDIIPRQTCDVIGCCRHGDIWCLDAQTHCNTLNNAAGNAVQLHRYIIYRKGSHFTVRFRPDWGWGCESEYEYHTIANCLKHIVLNSATYNDTELGFKIELYNANGHHENTINIRNKAELKQMIQNN